MRGGRVTASCCSHIAARLWPHQRAFSGTGSAFAVRGGLLTVRLSASPWGQDAARLDCDSGWHPWVDVAVGRSPRHRQPVAEESELSCALGSRTLSLLPFAAGHTRRP